jgi:hypothetical protein
LHGGLLEINRVEIKSPATLWGAGLVPREKELDGPHLGRDGRRRRNVDGKNAHRESSGVIRDPKVLGHQETHGIKITMTSLQRQLQFLL